MKILIPIKLKGYIIKPNCLKKTQNTQVPVSERYTKYLWTYSPFTFHVQITSHTLTLSQTN